MTTHQNHRKAKITTDTMTRFNRAVFSDGNLSVTQKLVALALMNCIDQDTGIVHIDQRGLADLCSLSRPTVIDAVRALEESNWVRVHRANGSGGQNHYEPGWLRALQA